MEDLTLALITLTSFVLLFVVAIFADRAGMDAADELGTMATATPEAIPVSVDATAPASSHADVA